MPKGKFGVRDFSDIDTKSTPTQVCDLPYEGDPFCGNDNNRRAHEIKMKREREASEPAELPASVDSTSQPIEPAAPAPSLPTVGAGDSTEPDASQAQPVAPAAAPSWTPRA